MKNLAIFCFILACLGSHLIAGKSVGNSIDLKENSFPKKQQWMDGLGWVYVEEPIRKATTTETSWPPQDSTETSTAVFKYEDTQTIQPTDHEIITEASTSVFKGEDAQTLQPTDHKSVTEAPKYSSELKVNLNLFLGFQSKSIIH